MTTLDVPELLGGRSHANQLLNELPRDLEGASVTVDLTEVELFGPSAIDELVRGILVERGAERLVLVGGPEEGVASAARAASEHGVGHRMVQSA